MLLVVTGIGFLITSTRRDTCRTSRRRPTARFFAYLNLFMAMMLTLVLGGTLPVVFVGWRGRALARIF